MTERITTQMTANQLLGNIENDLSQLDTTQNELSTGLQIEQPSDNPYGAALTIQLNGELSDIDSYTSNIADGTAWTQTAGAALQSVYQMGQSAQTLLVEANSGVESTADLKGMASQISGLIDSMKQTADTQVNGQYIFSGSATTIQPYATGTGSSNTYGGNTSALTRSIGPGTASQVAINADLSSVLGNGAGDGLMLDTLTTIQTDLQSGSTANLGAALTTLQSNLSQLSTLQASVGISQDRLQMASTRLQSLTTTDETELASTEDADMAQTTIKYSTEQAGYQAALQTAAKIVQTSLLNFVSG